MRALPPALPTRLRRLTRRARAYLGWERFALPLAVITGAMLVYIALAFSGVWQRIGDPWRLIGLGLTVGVVLRAAWALRGRAWPTRAEAWRRLEDDHGLDHRPLDALADTPALRPSGWAAHRRWAQGVSENIDVARLRPTLAPRDPAYLRIVLPLLALAAFYVGVGDNGERLRASLTPVWQGVVDGEALQFEAWVDPPDYTGRPPLYFRAADRLSAPEGSDFVARITGGKYVPRLRIKTQDGVRYVTPDRLGPRSFEVRTTIDATAIASFRAGSRREAWTVEAVPDRHPTIQFSPPVIDEDAPDEAPPKNPRADKRDRLSTVYDLSDDYGVETLQLELRLLSEDAGIAARRELIDIDLPRNRREVERQTAAIDLTRHPWAGRKVAGRLLAVDGANQVGSSAEAFFTVPDKIFVEPLAKAAIENRALLIADDTPYGPLPTRLDYELPQGSMEGDTDQRAWRLDRAPAEVRRAAELLYAITDAPQGFFTDPVVYSGLKTTQRQITYARSRDDLAGLDELLWSVALRAEFGRLGTALEDMQRAEEALRNAIARRAPQREVDALFTRYNDAVDRYLEYLTENAEMAEGGGGGGGDARNVDEIQALLDAIDEANRIGDTEGARRALAQLAELLENLQIQLTQGGGGGGEGQSNPSGEISEELKESLEDLADLLGEQRELKDETERAEGEADRQAGENGQETGENAGQQAGREPGQQPGQGGSQAEGTPSARGLAQRQQALEEALGELSEGLPIGELGGELGGEGDTAGESLAGVLDEAEDAMAEARDALGSGELGDAQDAQDAAIQALRRAGQSLAQAALGEREGEDGDGENPLGAENGGQNDDRFETDIDGRSNAQRSREILEDLRRRASEQGRSREELEYLERLLKRF